MIRSFASFLFALVFVQTSGAFAQSLDLPPTACRGLPIGTTAWYGEDSMTVKESDGMEMVFQLNGGRDWVSRYGLFLSKGEWQYPTFSNNPFVTKIDSDAQTAMQKLWPLKVGNKISVEIEEIHEWSVLPRASQIDFEVTSSAIVTVKDRQFANYIVVETAVGEEFSAGSGAKGESKHKTTHWYEPTAGLVVKSEKTAI